MTNEKFIASNAICPNCQHLLDAATNTENKANHIPQDGDISICLYCATLLRFNADFSLSRLDPGFVEELKREDYETYQKLLFAQLAVLQTIEQRKK